MKAKKTRGYMHRIIAASEKHPELFPIGEFRRPMVAHDEWCKSSSGGKCNCYPDITVQTPFGAFEIDQKGHCHSLN